MNEIRSSLKKRKEFLEEFCKSKILQFVEVLVNSILLAHENGGKIIICGNGGSAAESSHFAAELVVKYEKKRKPISAISLCNDVSILTAIGNDFDFNKIFERQIKCLGKKEDIFVVLSTSGNSQNIINAMKAARQKKLPVFALLGKGGGIAKLLSDFYYIDSSYDTAIIQEHQLIIIHLICELLDRRITK